MIVTDLVIWHLHILLFTASQLKQMETGLLDLQLGVCVLKLMFSKLTIENGIKCVSLLLLLLLYFRHNTIWLYCWNVSPGRASVAPFPVHGRDNLICGQMVQFAKLSWVIVLGMVFKQYYLSFVEGFHSLHHKQSKPLVSGCTAG